MTEIRDHLRSWFEALDELTYYDLFRVRPDATVDEVRAGFHVFCEMFHPDRHQARDEDERRALSTIFKRGTEAYLVLCDEALRGQYDEQLASAPQSARLSMSPHSRPPARRTGAPPALEESVRSPSARPFARRAEELVRKGDLRQAKLQLVMANHMDPDNPALESALEDLEAKLKAMR